MNFKNMSTIMLIIILLITSIILSINLYSKASLILNIIGSVLLVLEVKNLGKNYVTASFCFIGFSVLYGLSGPINVVWGKGLSGIFSKPYHINEFLIAYSIANIGFIIGIGIHNLVNENGLKIAKVNKCLEMVKNNKGYLLNTAIILAILGTVFEIINMMRIGGVMLLFAGKATYQGLISELTLTLPSSIVSTLSYACMGMVIGSLPVKGQRFSLRLKGKIFLVLIISSPYLLINMLLGRRGVLLCLFASIFVGVTFFRPIKKLKPKLALMLIILYLGMSFLYANRAIVGLIPERPGTFIQMAFSRERLIKGVNPGTNEFGAAFGNFSEYYGRHSTDFQPRLGSTYIKGLVVPIPSFIYPGEKPKQITYEFRDEFFPSEAERSSIAGTAYSSILEAYVNFKHIGIFFIYLTIGYLLQSIDKDYKYRNLGMAILYIVIFTNMQRFHRSSFGGIFANVFLSYIVILLLRGFKLFLIIAGKRGRKVHNVY